MHTVPTDHRLSPLEQAQLFEDVRQGALQARREAIDQFWSGVGRTVGGAWRALGRELRLTWRTPEPDRRKL